MRTIDDYLDTAKARQGITSDRQLSARLGWTETAVAQIRRRHFTMPDEKMMELARLAGVDETTALIELNIWRTHGETADQYRNMLELLAGARTAA